MTFYKILDVPLNADIETIKQKYKARAKELHPDLHTADERKYYEEKMKELNEAFDTLSSPEKRKAYDQKIRPKPSIQQRKPPPPRATVQPVVVANTDGNKRLIVKFAIIGGIIFCIVFAFILVVLDSLWSAPNNVTIQRNTSIANMIDILGDADSQIGNNYKYGRAVVLTDGYKITGWLDPYDELSTPAHNIIDENDLYLGMDCEKVIDKYGLPDTYSDRLIIYGNIVAYIENGYIRRIDVV